MELELVGSSNSSNTNQPTKKRIKKSTTPPPPFSLFYLDIFAEKNKNSKKNILRVVTSLPPLLS
jgi:hypothetical protein